jgi:hypothetical protein
VNTPLPDLGDLLHGAVDEIEPADRIDAIRARTANAPTRAARPWLYAAGGVVLATAATVAAFAVLDPSSPKDHGSMVMPTGEDQVVPVYFIGHTPRGPRLFREYDEVPAGDPLQAALDRIQAPADDPDYRTPWAHGSFASARQAQGVIQVEVGSAEVDPDSLSTQQVVLTLQAAVGERVPVRFDDGAPVTADVDALSQVMINDPTEGLEVHEHFTARGAANSFEANVPWEILDENDEVVAHGFATAAGTGRMYPWEAHIDVSDLPFGYYTFVATTDDPSGGEGGGPDSDTRTIIVR